MGSYTGVEGVQSSDQQTPNFAAEIRQAIPTFHSIASEPAKPRFTN